MAYSARAALELAGLNPTRRRVRRLAFVIGRARSSKRSIQGAIDAWILGERSHRPPIKPEVKKHPPAKSVRVEGLSLTGVERRGWETGIAWKTSKDANADYRAFRRFVSDIMAFRVGSRRPDSMEVDIMGGPAIEIDWPLKGSVTTADIPRDAFRMHDRIGRWVLGWRLATGLPNIPRVKVWHRLRGRQKYDGVMRVGTKRYELEGRVREGQIVDTTNTSRQWVNLIDFAIDAEGYFRNVENIALAHSDAMLLESAGIVVRYYTGL